MKYQKLCHTRLMVNASLQSSETQDYFAFGMHLLAKSYASWRATLPHRAQYHGHPMVLVRPPAGMTRQFASGTHVVGEKTDKVGYTGWLCSPTDASIYLMFIRPSENLPEGYNISTLHAAYVAHVDFSKATLGDQWAQCYIPER